MRAICCIFCSICCTRYLNALKILLLDRFSRCFCCCFCCCNWCSCCCCYLIYEIEWTAKNGLQTSASATVCTLCGKVFKLSVINSVVGCCISSYCTVNILLYAHRAHTFLWIRWHCWCVLLLSLFHKEVLCTKFIAAMRMNPSIWRAGRVFVTNFMEFHFLRRTPRPNWFGCWSLFFRS